MLFLLKPIVFIWAGLNVLDDLSSVMKISRLVGGSIPIFRRVESSDNLCDLCDDVVAGLMRGSEGLQSVPCSWICLRIPKCMNMCSHIQDVRHEKRFFVESLWVVVFSNSVTDSSFLRH
jgi:hypothetical protein